MNEDELRHALRGQSAPDPIARDRSWRVVRSAYADFEPPKRSRRPVRGRAIAAAVVVLLIGLASTSAPGDAVARWVQRMIGVGEPGARPALLSVPGGGRLLVTSPRGLWTVAPDGSKRLLGRYDGGSWSPRGLFVVAWRGRELTAVEPSGRPRWSSASSQPIESAAWSPIDGFRVAYVAGSQLRVINGDGTGDRRHGGALGRVSPSWRPDDAHVLAYADRRSRVRIVAVDAGRTLVRGPRLQGLRMLAWAPDGRRLLALTDTRVIVLNRAGDVVAAQSVPAGTRVREAAWAPDGARIALILDHRARDRSDVMLLGPGRASSERLLFTGRGRFERVVWSPRGDWLLLPWRDADQWLFLRARGTARVRAVSNIASQFNPGASTPSFPAVSGWCCRTEPHKP